MRDVPALSQAALMARYKGRAIESRLLKRGVFIQDRFDMPLENFSIVLDKLGSPEKAGSPDGPAFRVSAKVAEIMLSLDGVRARAAARVSPYDEEAAATALRQAPLTLSDLKDRVAGATSLAELRALRRRFARSCHPDRQKASDGAKATWEMAAANRMIDDAIGQMRRAR